jgi:hypothetical protein
MGHLTIIISITAIVLVLIGGGYFVVSNFFTSEPPPEDETPAEPPATSETIPPASPAPPKESVPSPPTPPKESAPPPEPSAQSVEEKVADFGQTVTDVYASGESQEMTLVFTEDEVNDQAAIMLAQTEIPEDIPLEIKSIHIDLQPDNNLLVEAKTTILGFGATLKATSRVSISEGKPKVDITKVSFGAILIPAAIKDAVVKFITQRTDEMMVQSTQATVGGAGIDLEFKEITTQEDKVTITVLVKKVT